MQLLEVVQIKHGRSHFAKEMHTSAGKSALQRPLGHLGPLKKGTWKYNVGYVTKNDGSVWNRSNWPTIANKVTSSVAVILNRDFPDQAIRYSEIRNTPTANQDYNLTAIRNQYLKKTHV